MVDILECVFIKFDKEDKYNIYVKVPQKFFGQEFDFQIFDKKICLNNLNNKFESPLLNDELFWAINENKVNFLFVSDDMENVFQFNGKLEIK